MLSNLNLVMVFSSALFLILSTKLFANEHSATSQEVLLERVKVTSQAEFLSFERVTQEVVVADEPFLDKGASPIASVDLRRRGGLRTQAFGIIDNLSLRGTNFEQNLVLIEGLRVSDLQTGHHILHLPFSSRDLRSIEVLSSGASPSFGAGGFGGAVNFLLAQTDKTELSSVIKLGSYDYQSYNLILRRPHRALPVALQLLREKSNGFIKNRDFDVRLANLYTKTERGLLSIGLVEKDFGAKNFFTPRYDTEWESTRTKLLLAKRLISKENFAFEPGLVLRENNDHYVLDRKNKTFYQNKHRSRLLRLNFPLRFTGAKSIYSLGLEGAYETLYSTRLGDHKRRSLGFFAGINSEFLEGLYFDLKVRYDLYAQENDPLSLGLGLSYVIRKGLKLRASVNNSYRLPSATELRYQAIGIRGNPALKPEQALNLEAGFDLSHKMGSLSFSLFARRGHNLIDWISNSTGTFAENIDVSAVGLNLHLTQDLDLARLLASYTLVNLSGPSLPLSRYHGNYLRHNLNLGLKTDLPCSTSLGLFLNVQKRLQQHEVYLLSAELTRTFKALTVKLWGENLFDERYYDLYYPLQKKGVEGQPLTLGLSIEIRL